MPDFGISPLADSCSSLAFGLVDSRQCLRYTVASVSARVENGEVAMTMIQKVQTKKRVVALVRGHRQQIRALGVKRFGLFGSFVREQQGKDSDVDVLVSFEPGQKTFDNFIHLSMLLEDLFGRHIEVLTPESLSPYIGPHILREVEYVTLDT